MRLNGFLFLLLGCLTVVSAAAAEGAPIRIGWIGPMTGPLAKWGSYQAVQIALDEINETGTVNGRKIELIYEDGKGKGLDAAMAAQKLLGQDRVIFILGGHCSPESLAIAPIVTRSNAVMIASITSSPLLTNAGDNVFRVTTVSTRGTEVVFDYSLKTLGKRKFAILFEESDYPRPQAERFKSLAQEHGGTVTAYEGILPGETDFRSILSRVLAGKPDAIYLATISPDTAALLLKQLKQLGSTVVVLGNENTGHAVDSSGQDKHAFEGVIFAASSYDPEDSKAKAFRDKFLARYQVEALPYGAYTAEAYDALHLLADIIGKCGDEVAQVKSCLYQVKDYHGASGTFSIDPNGDASRGYQMHIVKDGKVVNF